MKELFIITEITDDREDDRPSSFEVVGAWPTFEKALEHLKAIKGRQDDIFIGCGESKTSEISVNENKAEWFYFDYNNTVSYEISTTIYHE